MPQKLKRPCNYPGCPALIEAGARYCEKHKKQETQRYDRERGTAAQRGYGGRWQRYRLQYLRQHPLCVECESKGLVKPSKHVDHIKAVSGPDDPLFWAPDNHQALCHSCHSRKTVKEDGGFGNVPY